MANKITDNIQKQEDGDQLEISDIAESGWEGGKWSSFLGNGLIVSHKVKHMAITWLRNFTHGYFR